MALEGPSGGGGGRRPSVADTLAQATKALQTHREWMKRRMSTTVTPLEPEAADAPFSRRAAWSDPMSLEPAAGDGERPPSGTTTGEEASARVSPAPPTFRLPPLLLQRGSDQLGNERKRRGGSSAKVAPLPSLGEGGEEAVVDGADRPQPKLNAWGSDGQDALEDTAALSPLAAGQKTLTFTKPTKKPRVSRARVVPLASEASEREPASSAPVKTPLEAFFSSSYPSKVTPPPLVTEAAWGNLSLLDEYIESLEGGAECGEGENGGNGGGPPLESSVREKQGEHREGSVLEKAAETKRDEDEDGERSPLPSLEPATLSARTGSSSSSLELPVDAKREPSSTLLLLPSPPSPPQSSADATKRSDASQRKSSSLPAAIDAPLATNDPPATSGSSHFDGGSSSNIVPVTPAPRHLRTSYLEHKSSKLASSEEAGVRLLDATAQDAAKGEPAEDEPVATERPSASEDSLMEEKPKDISEATIKPVLPATRRTRRTGANVVAINTAFSIVTSGSTSVGSDCCGGDKETPCEMQHAETQVGTERMQAGRMEAGKDEVSGVHDGEVDVPLSEAEAIGTQDLDPSLRDRRVIILGRVLL